MISEDGPKQKKQENLGWDQRGGGYSKTKKIENGILKLQRTYNILRRFIIGLRNDIYWATTKKVRDYRDYAYPIKLVFPHYTKKNR